MEICVTVFLDVDDSIKNEGDIDLNTVTPERQQAILEQTTQSVVEITLKDHFKDCKSIEVGFVKANAVPQS